MFLKIRTMRFYYIIAVLLLTALSLSGQSKKKIRAAEIQVKITWKIDYVGGQEVKRKEKEETFTTSGEIAEYIEYENDGSTKSHIKYTYSVEDNLLKEVTLDKNGSVEQTIEYTYKGKLKTEKRTLNAKGIPISKKLYEYKFFK